MRAALLTLLIAFYPLVSMAGLFPKGCGTFRVLGTLRAAPLRIVLWQGTDSEVTLPIEGDCRKCGFLTDLAVEAEVSLAREGGPVSVLKIKPISRSPEMNSVAAATLRRKVHCLPDTKHSER